MRNYLDLHHCEILVTDLAQAMHFYTQILGMEAVPNPSNLRASKGLNLGDQEIHL